MGDGNSYNAYQVKNTWARAICTQAKFSDIRARVTLRDRLSRMPTSQELQSEIKAAKGINPPKTLEEKQKAREKRLKDMEKIIKAYEDGNEVRLPASTTMLTWNH